MNIIKYPYVNLGKQHKTYKNKFSSKLLSYGLGNFILENMRNFEKEFKDYIGTKYAIAGANEQSCYLKL